MAFVRDASMDLLLSDIDSNVTHLYICSQEPVSYAEASSTYALGNKASVAIAAPIDGSPNGRSISVGPITDGSVTGSATATHWALTSGSVLYSTGSLSTGQAVTSGNTFTLAAFTVRVADAT